MKKKQTRTERINALDRGFCDALKDALCSKVDSVGPVELTESEDDQLMSSYHQMVKADCLTRRMGAK